MKAPADLSTNLPVASLAGSSPWLAQCMLRVSDPAKSREFYENKLGMNFLTQLDFPDLKFSLLFFAYAADDDSIPDPSAPQADRAHWLWSRPYPTLELTHNWDSNEALVNGNSAPKGFGHIGIVVDDASKVVARLAETGVPVVREASPFADVGTLAFVEDPDSFWVEVIGRSGAPSFAPASDPLHECGLVGKDPVFAQVMIRVRDPAASIAFFEKLGMTKVASLHFPETSFSLYFMAYSSQPGPPAGASRAKVAAWLWKFRPCTIELTHNWVDNSDPAPQYTNGNETGLRGFGHVGVLVDDVYATTKRLDDDGYTVVRKAGPFKDVGEISFVASPMDNYWVELIQRSKNAQVFL
jgi:lactoylglutathione lyase